MLALLPGVAGVKLTVSCGPFEALPPKVWECLRRAIETRARNWGVTIEVAEDLSVREAESRFHALSRIANERETSGG